MNTDSTQTTVNTELLIKRYKDAYTVATVIISFGTALKAIGFLFGIGLFIAGFAFTENAHGMPDSAKTVYIVSGAVLGIILWLIFYVLGVLSSCQGQVLRAGLDEAVYVCPFFTDANRVIAANLPTSRSA